MIPVMHMRTTYDRKPAWAQLLSPCGWERKKSGQQLVKWEMEGAKKREVGHTSFLVLDVPICRGSLGVGCLCVGSYS